MKKESFFADVYGLLTFKHFRSVEAVENGVEHDFWIVAV